MVTVSSTSLSASSLIKNIHECFSIIPDPRNFNRSAIPIIDHLMSGFAIFSLKFPSLLSYDDERKDSCIKQNLRDLYMVKNAPSDTYLRERLDEVDPEDLRPSFKKLFSVLQRGKGLEEFEFLNGYYILSMDGTGKFSSSKICPPHCCTKEHSDGTKTYYHQMLGACIVHPEKSNVIPLCPELIENEDGSKKNDCERNAAKRLLENFRREHPHLKVIVVEDGLSSNAPHIECLEQYNMKYVLGAKPGDHGFLFNLLDSSDEVIYHEFEDDKGTLHQFRYLNNVSLNKSNPDTRVNFLEYEETTSTGEVQRFSWVTNITISIDNIYQLMIAGRARWKIENETFNTLKNLGYNFEHNYGHGKKHLTAVFSLLMMLAFLVDQIQEIGCRLFQFIKKLKRSYRKLWESMRILFTYMEVASWEIFYQILAKKLKINLLMQEIEDG